MFRDLVDPGGKITFGKTLRQLETRTGFQFVVHGHPEQSFRQSFFIGALHFRHQTIPVGVSAFRILIEDLFAILQGRFEITGFDEKPCPAQKIVHVDGIVPRAHLRPGSFFPPRHLLYAVEKILNEADLAHILRLKHGKFPGQIVSRHVPVTGDDELGTVLFHQRQKTAPFVFHPDRFEKLLPAPDHQHHFRRIQRGENVRLVLSPQLPFEGDARKEDLVTLIGQLIIDFLSIHGVPRPGPAVGGFLVADEDVVRFFLRRNGQDPLLDLLDPLSLLFVEITIISRCKLHGPEIIRVFGDGVVLHPVAGGEPFVGGGILHIFDAEARQDQAPIPFRILRRGLDVLTVSLLRPIEVVVAPELLRPVVELFRLTVRKFRKGGQGAAIGTLPLCHALGQLQLPAAHFTLYQRHKTETRISYFISAFSLSCSAL